MKGQATMDLTVDHLVPLSPKLYEGIPNEILKTNVTSYD